MARKARPTERGISADAWAGVRIAALVVWTGAKIWVRDGWPFTTVSWAKPCCEP